MERVMAIDEDLQALGEQVIAEENLFVVYKPKIGYLRVAPYINKSTIAKCIRASEELNFFSEYDYLIKVSEDALNNLDASDIKIILFHEMCKMLPIYNEKTDAYIMKIQDFEIQDFHRVLNKHKSTWKDDIKVQIASIRDLDPDKQELLKF